MGESLLLTAVQVKVTFMPRRAIVVSGCTLICGLGKLSEKKSTNISYFALQHAINIVGKLTEKTM